MKIPDYLDNFNNEFIVIDSGLFKVEIKLIPFRDIPIQELKPLQSALDADEIANAALDVLNYTNPYSRLTRYVMCNFGGFDNTADICSDGSTRHEYVECGQRGNCIVEGKLCKALKVENGVLTPREIQIISLIGKDKMDKEIADILGITLNTATTHRQNITRKMNGVTKSGIAAFAIEKNL